MCYEKLYVNKFDNLDEMDKSLERCKLSKMTQEKISVENLIKPITNEETK